MRRLSPAPRSTSTPSLILMILVATAALINGCSSADDSSAASRDSSPEEQISTVVEKSMASMREQDNQAFNDTQCQDKKITASQNAHPEEPNPLTSINFKGVSAIEIAGSTATATVEFSYDEQPRDTLRDSIKLRKEEGRWLIC